MRSEPCRPTCVNEFHVPLQVPVNHEHLVAARMRTGPLPNFFVMLFDVFLGRKDRVLTARLKAEIEAEFFLHRKKKQTTPQETRPSAWQPCTLSLFCCEKPALHPNPSLAAGTEQRTAQLVPRAAAEPVAGFQNRRSALSHSSSFSFWKHRKRPGTLDRLLPSVTHPGTHPPAKLDGEPQVPDLPLVRTLLYNTQSCRFGIGRSPEPTFMPSAPL